MTTEPLLQQLYRRGHSQLPEVPDWADHVLAAPDVPSAARALDPSATRRTMRALATSLTRLDAPSAPDLGGLAFAVIGSGLLSPDHLANVLDAHRPERAAALPTADQIAAARRALELWPYERRWALVRHAAQSTTPEAFAEMLRKFGFVDDLAPERLPTRWGDLVNLCQHLLPLAASMASSRPTDRAEHHHRVDGPRSAPIRRAPPSAILTSRWETPERLKLVEGLEIGDLRLVMPTSPHELRGWGRALRNCLADFRVAVGTGHSWIVGIRKCGALVGCVEIEPFTGMVRQMLGSANQPLPAQMRESVLEALWVVAAVRA